MNSKRLIAAASISLIIGIVCGNVNADSSLDRAQELQLKYVRDSQEKIQRARDSVPKISDQQAASMANAKAISERYTPEEFKGLTGEQIQAKRQANGRAAMKAVVDGYAEQCTDEAIEKDADNLSDTELANKLLMCQRLSAIAPTYGRVLQPTAPLDFTRPSSELYEQIRVQREAEKKALGIE